MAYIDSTDDGGNYYNVNFAVGSNAPNKRDDVLLVQWMLHRIYIDDPRFAPGPDRDIRMDGWIGPQTIRWITAFQRAIRRLGLRCLVDGRVDSARVSSEGSVSKTVYTIMWMNEALLESNPTVFGDATLDPSCPPELLAALATKDGSTGPYLEPVPATGGA
jgi:hypothetical protein